MYVVLVLSIIQYKPIINEATDNPKATPPRLSFDCLQILPGLENSKISPAKVKAVIKVDDNPIHADIAEEIFLPDPSE